MPSAQRTRWPMRYNVNDTDNDTRRRAAAQDVGDARRRTREGGARAPRPARARSTHHRASDGADPRGVTQKPTYSLQSAEVANVPTVWVLYGHRGRSTEVLTVRGGVPPRRLGWHSWRSVCAVRGERTGWRVPRHRPGLRSSSRAARAQGSRLLVATRSREP